ncbi:TetR/AcrR family transcriptional regulator (plasmid) [Streptomyces scopuliridis]|uniref:TetR/AcrR family transcriptional regulator n=1 Tax=Streptomyces scopuliridis TaxID=452529 RepID=A0ACD4ZYH4_9ACTN|nr:TetR/AcrR family transcriptional regulator [Streptomyces scopuliridis]WSB39244.1 TetR/AcrR family transcriptional regulator [Streptomyces scopuliridis]WSC03485.1 TetR/AcrR family transcriptional regulator [Streptomyces scopuliridis]WSC11370.1 TetR/AcrR family transcriptional regulator [Streptomyces scopuliridis]
MTEHEPSTARRRTPRRLSKAERRRHLLETALAIVREEGADRLTLGHLAARAEVSKPVAYDHFGTRSGLLIDLYRWIDTERVNMFRDGLNAGRRTFAETAGILAAAYVACAGNTGDEFYAVGAALAGSAEKAEVYQELLDQNVQMFVSVLEPHTAVTRPELERCCVGLVGAGEALSAALVHGKFTEDEAVQSFASLIRGSLPTPSR